MSDPVFIEFIETSRGKSDKMQACPAFYPFLQPV